MTPHTSWRSRAVDYLQKVGGNRKKNYYRCGRCRKRKVLKKELWQYSRPPKCCGGVHWIIDMSRYNEWKSKTGAYECCRCDASHWPHKRGSLMLCVHTKLTMEEQEQIYLSGAFLP